MEPKSFPSSVLHENEKTRACQTRRRNLGRVKQPAVNQISKTNSKIIILSDVPSSYSIEQVREICESHGAVKSIEDITFKKLAGRKCTIGSASVPQGLIISSFSSIMINDNDFLTSKNINIIFKSFKVIYKTAKSAQSAVASMNSPIMKTEKKICAKFEDNDEVRASLSVVAKRIPADFTMQQLLRLFERFGDIESSKEIRPSRNSIHSEENVTRSYWKCVITYKSYESSLNALNGMKGKILIPNTKPILVLYKTKTRSRDVNKNEWCKSFGGSSSFRSIGPGPLLLGGHPPVVKRRESIASNLSMDYLIKNIHSDFNKPNKKISLLQMIEDAGNLENNYSNNFNNNNNNNDNFNNENDNNNDNNNEYNNENNNEYNNENNNEYNNEIANDNNNNEDKNENNDNNSNNDNNNINTINNDGDFENHPGQ